MIIRCPRCNLALKVHTTVSAWNHIERWHVDWMRELFKTGDGSAKTIKRELYRAFPGIVG